MHLPHPSNKLLHFFVLYKKVKSINKSIILLPFILLLIMTPGHGQVLEVANSYMGKRVSTGICWQLVQRVLKESGTTVSFSDTVKDVRPGDIYNSNGVYDSIIPVVDKDGYVYADNCYGGTPAHIAIVSQVLGDSIYEIIEQNGEGRRDKVRKRIIDIKLEDNQTTWGQYFLRPRKGEYTKETKHFISKYTIHHPI